MKNIGIVIFGGIILIAILVLMFKPVIFKNQPSKIQTNTKVQVVTSFYPMYFFTLQIAGDKADVKNITPAGVEPHDYEPTAQDIANIEKSDLLILNGGDLETWGDKIKNNLKGTKVTIITAGEKIAKQDPHVWLSPSLAMQEVKTILYGFIKVDPNNKDFYILNTEKLLTKLANLDKNYQQGLSNCKQKDIITSHSAFWYLAQEYGLNQVTITGISPDEEPSPQKLAEIVKYAKEHNVKYVFVESLASPKLSETIAYEAGAKTLILDPIEGVSNQDLKAGKNYFTLMDSNLKNLRTALTCQ